MEKILRKPTFDEEEARSTIAKYRQENAGKKQEYAEHELQLMRQKHAIFQVLTPERRNNICTCVRHTRPMTNIKPLSKAACTR